ncbi:M20 family metallopeptidase [Bacillus chungangensis]|uniref:Succinyl-diaminopimelate desuccinylase n=1 Tax=Bacillus chungangensis TaxID=587633 RepID=A0ABT9WZB4_9BACI|nr:M20 family metallopeptidase [Bacillus chungangensis]MDQ0178458.1 succinyl-diaminopimelate desuccinylase [Bacillus chungangensis]
MDRQFDTEAAIHFLQKLIKINSINPPGNELDVAKLLQKELAHTDLTVKIDEFETGRANILIANTSTKSATMRQPRKRLVLSGHLDTVPLGKETWKIDPFQGKIEGNRIYGRGSTDMKSGLAAMIFALRLVSERKVSLDGDVVLVGTAGEEVDGCGAKRAIQKDWLDNCTAMIVGEPTANEIVTAHKGTLWVSIALFGKTAHGSMPEQGKNTLLAMNEVINELQRSFLFKIDQHALLGKNTINFATIEGGIQTNMVPDDCRMTVDIRTIPGQSHQIIFSNIEKIVKMICEKHQVTSKIDILNNMGAVSTPTNHPFIELAAACKQALSGHSQKVSFQGVNYYTDASVFTTYLPTVPVLLFGPGEPHLAHQPNEWADIEKYIFSIRYYVYLIIGYLKC